MDKKKRIILITVLVFVILLIYDLLFNNIYAADIKLEIKPRNPIIGTKFSLNATITGNDCYSIAFLNLNESSNLEYISMDAKKTAKGDTPLTGLIKAEYKVKESGDAWIDVKLEIESATLKNKKLDTNSITSKIIEKRIKVEITPEASNVDVVSGKFQVTDNDVNIRPHPSTKYSSLGVYNKGKIIEVTGKSGDWYQFKYNNMNAYMHKDYLKEIVETPKQETEELKEELKSESETEETTDPKVKDPKEQSGSSAGLIIFAIFIAIAIIIVIIYLIKSRPKDDEYYDEDYDEDYDENDE